MFRAQSKQKKYYFVQSSDIIYIVLLSKLFLAPWVSFTIKKLWILIWFRFIRTIKKIGCEIIENRENS